MLYSKRIYVWYLTYVIGKHIVFIFALSLFDKCKVVFLHFMKMYGGVEVQHHAFVILNGQPHVLAPQPPWIKSLLWINIKIVLKKLCFWCRLIDCVGSCIDCYEFLALMNCLILFNCLYLKKGCPKFSH